jgi:hypothetical protein
MQSALKPTRAVLQEYRTTPNALAETLLDAGVSVTPNGLQKLDALLNANEQAIGAAVKNASGTIDKSTVAARALQTAGRVANQTNPTRDLQAVGETVGEFLNHPISGSAPLSIPEAQAMKVGTYAQIGKKYGEVANASIETQKALARGLKEEIAARVPGIADLNAQNSQLSAALDAVGRRVAQEGNKDPVGFAWAAVQRPSAFIAALIDRNAAVKSAIARGAWALAGRMTGVPGNLIAGAVAAIASGTDDSTADPAIESRTPTPTGPPR